MSRLIRRILLVGLIATLTSGIRPQRAAADRRDDVAAELQSVEKKIADAEAMQSAINRSPEDYADVSQTLRVLGETLAKLRASKDELNRELSQAAEPSPAPAPTPHHGAQKKSGRSVDSPRRKDLQALEAAIVTNAASKAAVAEAKRAMREMLSGVDDSVVHAMVQHRVTLELVPKGKTLLDLPDLASLKGAETADHGTFADRGGVSDVRLKDGRIITAVLETNLVGTGAGSGYPKDFLIYHEFAHAVHEEGVAAAALTEISRAHEATQAQPDLGHGRGHSGLGDYADTNKFEHFAQAAAAFFHSGYGGEGPADLKKADPKMYECVDHVFHAKAGTP